MWNEQTVTWGSLRVGATLKAGEERWHVVAIADEHEVGKTPWIRIRSDDGRESSVAPKPRSEKVTVIDPDAAEFGSIVNSVRDLLGAQVTHYDDFATGATYFQRPSTMTNIQLADHIVRVHNTPASLTDSLDKLTELHDKLHKEGGHGASHGHL